MDRIHSIEKLTEMIKDSDSMSEKEKSDYIETYKKNYYLWLDELKQKLQNYEPLFTDLRINSSSFNYSEHNLQGEIWKNFPLDKKYSVSNLGRVKFEGKIQAQVDETDTKTGKPKIGYLVLEDKNLRRDYVYSMVAFTFLDKIEGDGYQVHHITNNGYDNRSENLVLLTQEEHSYVHGFEIGGQDDKYGAG